LRLRDPRHDRQRGSARGQTQKFPTVGRFHGVSSRKGHQIVRLGYSGFAPENLTTLAHFSVSFEMCVAKSAADPALDKTFM
jgi:hypothetical protein